MIVYYALFINCGLFDFTEFVKHEQAERFLFDSKKMLGKKMHIIGIVGKFDNTYSSESVINGANGWVVPHSDLLLITTLTS